MWNLDCWHINIFMLTEIYLCRHIYNYVEFWTVGNICNIYVAHKCMYVDINVFVEINIFMST